MSKVKYRQRKPTIYKVIQEKGKKPRCGKCKQPTFKASINLGSIDGIRQKDIEVARFCKNCKIIYQRTKIEIDGYK